MSEIEKNNSYSEVFAILNKLCIEDYNKIPKEIIKAIEINRNPSYIFEYDTSKTLDEQNVSKYAKTIIAILFRDYWASPNQREKILKKEEQDSLLDELEKQKIYSYDNLFNGRQKKKNIDIDENSTIQENKELLVIEKKWYIRAWHKILKIFRR